MGHGLVRQRGQADRGETFLPPNPTGSPSERSVWLEKASKSFVAPSQANKEYYRVILETLWPEGHGIPGPVVSQEEIRTAIDLFRKRENNGTATSYRDPFRRMRELQGEEGFTGIIKVGQKYQLVSLKTKSKRKPRTTLTSEKWIPILRSYEYRCAVCGRKSEEDIFDKDHKIPRLRGGSDEPENWQPLCAECNNFKSVACRGCELDCNNCPWAFPEKYPLLRLSPALARKVKALSDHTGKTCNEIVEAAIDCFLNK